MIAFAMLVTAATTYAAENACEFTVASETGEVLGSGMIRLPFKFGADGKGTADWQFTPTRAVSTNKYWMKAKARLASGGGKARAECKDSWFTLDFNPGWHDNNVTVSWGLKKREFGDLYFADISGGHPCASFRISQPTQRNAAPPNSQGTSEERYPGIRDELKRGREIIQKLSALLPEQAQKYDGTAFRGEVVTFVGGSAPPGATNDLLIEGGYYLRVVNPAAKDLRPHAVLWEVVVKGKIMHVLPEHKIIVLEVQEKDWFVLQPF